MGSQSRSIVREIETELLESKWLLPALVLILLHIPYAAAVYRFVPESSQWYLPLMAPAGIIANFLLPLWLVGMAWRLYRDG